MAIITRYVNTASTPGGDGTTTAITGTARAYASASEWEANEQTDLVSDGDSHVVHSVGTAADTVGLWLAGWVTLSTNTITVNGDNTTGKYSTGHYRIELTASGTYTRLYSIANEHVELNDLQGKLTASISYNASYNFTVWSNNVYVNRCIAQNNLTLGSPQASYVYSGFYGVTAGAHFNNCLYYETGNKLEATGFGSRGVYNNCTAYDSDRGFYTTWKGMALQNCLLQSCTGGYETSDRYISADYCCSDIVGDAPGTNPVTGTVSFVDAAGGDFSPASSDTVAKDAGLDLSATFTDDLAGSARPTGAGSWDIGALEYIATSGLNITLPAIASGEAFGGLSVSPGNVTLSTTAIDTQESIGAISVTPATVILTPNSINSAEQHGTASVSIGPVSIQPSAIVSAEQIGVPELLAGIIISTTGIISAENIGALSIAPGAIALPLSAIASAEQHGNATLTSGVQVSPASIASEEQHGAHDLLIDAVINALSISSDEAIGTLTVDPGSISLELTGIASGESMGSATIAPGSLVILPSSIDSLEIIGGALLIQGAGIISPTAINSAETLGNITLIGGADLIGWMMGEINIKPAVNAAINTKSAIHATLGVNRVH